MDTIAHFSWAGWIRDVSSKITSLHFRSEANREMRVMERTCQVPFPKLQQFHFTMPTMRHLDAITFLHLLKHLERMMAVPNTEVALPLYSSASLSEVLGQLAEDVKAFFPLGYASYLYPSSTYSPFLATTPSPSSETQLSSLSYRQWSAPKTSPLLTCIRLEYISLGVLEWFKILDTIDLPALEELSLMGTNIMDQHILMMKGRLSPESSMTVEEEGQDSSNRQRHTGVRMKLLNLKNCHYITAEKKTQFTAWIDRYLDA
ncbi:hypothetical protein BC939DRAFT_435292 [Gamsiella multidivaricata]|uniref:uncharacterized protein n=1 Tax=Gamsiella multidivaricata TaxID=101098 RepID=UPI00222044DA|nr:uncharacterized protein BC939DRAFT_435292 [Gamsiella multidivaricata]KAI7832362.1 hypothetical protein BC939DRAFT_435292 [Gamsiella multidivaricata]